MRDNLALAYWAAGLAENCARIAQVLEALGVQGLAGRPPAPDAVAPTAPNVDVELALQQELHYALAGKTRSEVVTALIHGTLHPAITINWAAVAGGQG